MQTGASLDCEGRPFPRPSEATCLLFDSLAEAEAFCAAKVGERPFLRLEIFDSEGRLHPPLVVFVAPAYERKLPANPSSMRMRKRAAIALGVGAVPLIVFDVWASNGVMVLPTLVALNMIVVAARLLHINLGARDAERKRLERLERHHRSS